MKRACGILLPLFSLPSPHGFGTMGEQANRFVDFLSEAGQRYWQLLPIHPTGYGDSPYQSFSAFASNPYMIDLDGLSRLGLLTETEIEAACLGGTTQAIDYAAQYERRLPLLKTAAARFDHSDAGYCAFCARESFWLEDYALFMSLKEENGPRAFSDWPEALRLRLPAALAAARERLSAEMANWRVLEYLFDCQWRELRRYAGEKGIRLIGDMPIYVSPDSADLWASPPLFQLDEKGRPTEVAGCPPDAFSTDGQLWGNPLYDWEEMRRDGYGWWIQRLKKGFERFDVMRIDHFRGLESYYAIPYGAKNAVEGRWRPGPGEPFIEALHEAFDRESIIAEDLGFLTPAVRSLLQKSGYPGMKVLQFAFDSREESDYMPHNFSRNCVVYTGTHDNDTMCGWIDHAPPDDVSLAFRYLAVHDGRDAQWAFIRAALASVADLAVIPLQDYLGLGSEARINTPSTLGNNWSWRLPPGALTPVLAGRIRELTELYGRHRPE